MNALRAVESRTFWKKGRMVEKRKEVGGVILAAPADGGNAYE